MENLVEVNINIENLIYEIRGKQVMLDSDLARLYQCKNGTKDINKAVKRNIKKFPEDFYFQLTKEECSRFQIGTLNVKQGENIKYLPHAFTEQGVAMLASVLHTEIANVISIKIMRAFVTMKKYISNNIINQNYISNKIIEHDERIKILESTFNKFEEKEKINSIFFEGQIYDAYSLLLDIFNEAKENIIIIDNYFNKELLDIICELNINVTIISKNYDELLIKKYKLEYHNLNIIISDKYHDRFIIIDKKILYHCGSSFKDLGKKCFGINKIIDNNYLKQLLENI